MKLNARTRYFLDRLQRIRRTLEEVASEREVIFPETERDAAPAIHLDGQLSLITAVQPETTDHLERLRLRGGRQRHRATVRYLLKDAILVGGDLYAGGARLPLRPGTTPQTALGRVREELPAASLVQSYAGAERFGHWLLDDRPTQTMAVAWAPPVTTPVPLSQQQREYLDVFGQARPHQAGATLVRELHVFDDVGQNFHRRERLERLRACFQSLKRHRDQVVFICRGHDGTRRLLLNEDYIAARLEERGAVVIRHPERLPVSELAARIGGARLVVGLDSSALAPGILGLPRGGGLVVISPANRHHNGFKDWCDSLGLHYGVVIAPQKENGYVVGEEHLLRTIDLVLEQRAAA